MFEAGADSTISGASTIVLDAQIEVGTNTKSRILPTGDMANQDANTLSLDN